jgi:hypothetical protein
VAIDGARAVHDVLGAMSGPAATDRTADEVLRQWLWTWGLLGVGLLARIVRYGLRFPLWEDECFLAVSLDRSYSDLSGPLPYHQVAPVAFLWLQKAMVDSLGFGELSLRLVPFLAGLLAPFLFARVAALLLPGWSAVLACGVFSVAYPGIRYAAEAKPYGTDLTLSLLLLWAAVEGWRSRRAGWAWLLLVLAPLAVTFSFPAIFMAGGIGLLAAAGLRGAPRRARLGLVLYASLTLAALAGSLLASSAQQAAELDWMQGFWRSAFPPLRSPGQLALWALDALSGHALAVPVGGGNGGSTASLLVVAAGILAWVRARQWPLLGLTLTPWGLHLAAAAVQRYPFGGHVKFSMVEVPLLCLLAGAGLQALLAWTPADRRPAALGLVLGLLAALGAGSIARDVAHPYKTESDERARGLARWLWSDLPLRGELVCLKTDLGRSFAPDTFRELSWSAMYLANQRLYSARHREGRPPAWQRISGDWPLQVVEFRDASHAYDSAAQQRWLREMQASYLLRSEQALPLARRDKRERLLKIDEVHLYTFVPRDPGP